MDTIQDFFEGTHNFSGGQVEIRLPTFGLTYLVTLRQEGKLLSTRVEREELERMYGEWDRMSANCPTGPFGEWLSKKLEFTPAGP